MFRVDVQVVDTRVDGAHGARDRDARDRGDARVRSRATATTAALIPAPGTGHGVIGATTPAEEGASLKVTPGVGGAAEAACLASPLVEAQRTLGQVGGSCPSASASDSSRRRRFR